MTFETLTANATKLGHGSHVVAAAGFVLGMRVQSLCCWCVEKVLDETTHIARLPAGGECDSCPYVGRDCLAVSKDAENVT